MLIKTIRGKLHDLTNKKEKLLEREYDAFQKALQGKDINLYSATAQEVPIVKKQKNPRNEQPVRLRNDVIRVEEQDTPLSKHWIKIPIYNPKKSRGDSIWCPITFPKKDWKLLKDADIGDSELIRRNGEWFVHLVVKNEIEIRGEYSDILAIDMGARWIAVTTFLSDRKTKFYGRKLRQVREHYKQLRKNIGKKKVKKRLGHKESRTVEDQLHKIARSIVNDAKKRNAFIVYGDLKGIRNGEDKGRKFNDKLHKFPFSKLAKFIKYKAKEKGIFTVAVPEKDTSKTCNRCGSTNTTRINQGLFKCNNCGLEDNADKNGALNIGKRVRKRALGKFSRPLSKAGAVLAQPITPPRGFEPLPLVSSRREWRTPTVVGDGL